MGSEQEVDLSEAPNCGGLGRIRHFKIETSTGWPSNPLPIAPACKALNLPMQDVMRAQVFQNGACNWRCWYCFVPFNLLSADVERSRWVSASDLVNLYLNENDRPSVIDLSGGQPDLIPEWTPWMMEELIARGLQDSVYLWSDDNLSNDYFWRYLSGEQLELVRGYKNYGRVCCFKGFDRESFSFNTLADPDLFDFQFELIRKFIELGIDTYAYVTLTSPADTDRISLKVRNFVDKLQQVHTNLPLRTIPLEIAIFSPVKSRITTSNNDAISRALTNQEVAIQEWNNELRRRYSDNELARPITQVILG
ncbi:radical SAM protein [Candidatus Nitrososphaera evergladensis]|uniref:radical SAM protein n=1 Tax=Candidatus Nitrososphaera evergladensis TaxID=1459637 RepID=UPI0011E59CCD|nr:hypothetical protein [Candidatus Nitrososphaera evergladensis]